MDELDHARALLREHPVIDGHNDLPMRARQDAYDYARFDISRRRDDTHTDLVRLREGGVGGQFWSVYVSGAQPHPEAVVQTLEQIDGVQRMVAAYPDHLALATTADEVEAAMAAGKVASLMGAEGGQSIAGSPGVLRQLYCLGVRYLTLTHNQNVGWADAATDKPDCGGLSGLGREIVAEMNRLGMLVDISHVAVTTMNAVLDVTTRPVIFSHSGARAVTDHVRNAPDDVLRRLADNGGVCMAVFAPAFVSQAVAEHVAAFPALAAAEGIAADTPAYYQRRKAWLAANPGPRATLADAADHLDHLRAVAGADHIGIGGDFDGIAATPEGLEDVSRYPHLIAELVRRGWPDDDLARLTCRNILRVLRDNEA